MTQQHSVAWVFCYGCKCAVNSDCISTWKDRAAVNSWLSVIRCTGVNATVMMAKVQHGSDTVITGTFLFLSVCLYAGAPWPFSQIKHSKVGFKWNGRSVLQSALPGKISNQSSKFDVYSYYMQTLWI